MATITRKVIERSLEDKLITGMILSAKFLREIVPLYKPEYIKNPFAQRICSWVIDYFLEYDKAPKKHIKDIFEIERAKIESEEEEIIKIFLSKLDKKYKEDQEINEQFFIDEVIKYFDEKEIEITYERMGKFLAAGKVQEAKLEIVNFKKVARITSSWYNPFDVETIRETFTDSNDTILQLDGKLGQFIGPLERGWLITVVAGYKRGKTWSMEEIGLQGLVSSAVSHNLKVASISLEMKKKNRNERLYKRVTALANEKGNIILPCFDCISNQDDSCDLSQRINDIPLPLSETGYPKYKEKMDYKPCTACRNLPVYDQPNEYKLTSWYTSVEKDEYDYQNASKILQEFTEMWGDNYRAISYPRFSATLTDIKRDLDLLDYTEGFIPDIIILDYIGIIKPDRFYSKEYQMLDELWKSAAGLAEERHTLLITGSQINREQIKGGNVEEGGLAGWIGQEAHIDKSFALNQTKEEKIKGMIRWNKLADRHQDFNEAETCLVLQNLKIGQPVLDSELIYIYR